MESQFIFPFILRFLPSLLLIGLAFVAASDKKTGRQWANMLYQMGSVRPDQRDDPKIHSGVKLPFFVLAFAMLFLPSHIGPISYFRWVTNKNAPVLDLTQGKGSKDSDDALIKMEKEQAAEPTPTLAPQNPPPPGGVVAPPPPRGAPPASVPRNSNTTPGGIGALR